MGSLHSVAMTSQQVANALSRPVAFNRRLSSWLTLFWLCATLAA